MPDIIETLKEKYATNQAECLNMLPELFKQYDEGLIKVLPCKVGKKVYRAVTLCNGEKLIVEGTAFEYSISNSLEQFYFSELPEKTSAFNIWCNIDDFGKTVFLTREAAEEVLKSAVIGNDHDTPELLGGAT